ALDLDGEAALVTERMGDFVPGLREELLAVREDEDRSPRDPRKLRENHGLSGSGRQADDHPANASAARSEDGFDRLPLIGPQLQQASGHSRSIGRNRPQVRKFCRPNWLELKRIGTTNSRVNSSAPSTTAAVVASTLLLLKDDPELARL